MNISTYTYGRSGLGIFTRLIGIILLIIAPLIIFSPELFPNISDGSLDFITTPLKDISLTTRTIIALIYGLRELILVVGLFAMASLFDLIASKHWFLPDLSHHLKTFGMSLVIFMLAAPVVNFLITISMVLDVFYNFSNYDLHNTVVKFSFSGQGLLVILIGILLILLAQVLQKASENAHDLEQIV